MPTTKKLEAHVLQNWAKIYNYLHICKRNIVCAFISSKFLEGQKYCVLIKLLDSSIFNINLFRKYDAWVAKKCPSKHCRVLLVKTTTMRQKRPQGLMKRRRISFRCFSRSISPYSKKNCSRIGGSFLARTGFLSCGLGGQNRRRRSFLKPQQRANICRRKFLSVIVVPSSEPQFATIKRGLIAFFSLTLLWCI